MRQDEIISRIWSVLEKTHICMMTTRRDDGLRARPMGMYPERNFHRIYFLTDERGMKDDDIATAPKVVITAQHGGTYVSVSGYATVTEDRETIARLWTSAAKAWWSGPDDPNIRLIKLSPEQGEIWETPGIFVGYVAMMAAAVTGAKPKVGEAHKTQL
jgi:general stress protein 26